MLTIYFKTIKETKISQIPDFKIGSWVHLESPTTKELSRTAEMTGADISLLKDALDFYEVPRLEVEEEDLYIYTRVPVVEKEQVITLPFLLVLSSKYILTEGSLKFNFLEKFIDGSINFNTTQKIKFFILIFSEINAIYSRQVYDLNKNIRNMGFSLEKIHNKDIIHLVSFENILYDFLSALVPTNTILINLLNGKLIKLYKEDHDLVEDLLLANNQILELAKATLKTIRNTRESYSTIMTNNLNRVIKFFTALTIVITVPNIIGSFFGMNVLIPLGEFEFAFGLIVGFSVLISLLLLWFFKKEDWL